MTDLVEGLEALAAGWVRSHGGSVDLTLRVPVPASARTEGVRVFEFYRPTDRK